MLVVNFKPFPTLETERLRLRRITAADADVLFQLRSSTEVMKYIDRPMAHTIDDAYEWLRKVDEGIEADALICWGIEVKGAPGLIGTISYHRIIKEHFRAEIGYMLAPAYWNKGYASEALRALIQYGFNVLKLHSIEANVNPLNEASKALLIKHRFVQEAYFREDFFFNGVFMDTMIFSLLIEPTRLEEHEEEGH